MDSDMEIPREYKMLQCFPVLLILLISIKDGCLALRCKKQRMQLECLPFFNSVRALWSGGNTGLFEDFVKSCDVKRERQFSGELDRSRSSERAAVT